MLQNFTDREIRGELLETGYLYLEKSGAHKRIERVAEAQCPYTFKKDGEGIRRYPNLTALLINEGLTFEDIRADWKYHGALLTSTVFCEKLVYDRGFVAWCKGVIASERYVILDTETTSKYGEIIDLAIIDSSGSQLYNKLLHPLGAIGSEAMGIHRITEAMVARAPSILEEWYEICQIVAGRTVITYNSKFDSERITYSLRKHGMHLCGQCQWSYECAMLRYAEFYGAPPQWEGAGPGWQSLSNACYQQGIMLLPGLHRAMPDCQATLALIRQIAATGENAPRYERGE